MVRSAKNVLDAFQQLAAREREDVVREFLGRTALSLHESASDEELLLAADAVFLDLDQREA
jgi:hypothetical protein